MRELDSLANLRERVRRLERANRRLTLGFLVATALGVALLAGGAKAAPGGVTVEASRFVLKNAAGELRGALFVEDDGGGALVLYGYDGQRAARLPQQAEAIPIKHRERDVPGGTALRTGGRRRVMRGAGRRWGAPLRRLA